MSWFKVKVDSSLPVVPSNITHSPCESKGWRDSGVTIITEVVYHVSFPSITKNWIDSRFVIGFFLFRFVVIVWIYSRQSPSDKCWRSPRKHPRSQRTPYPTPERSVKSSWQRGRHNTAPAKMAVAEDILKDPYFADLDIDLSQFSEEEKTVILGVMQKAKVRIWNIWKSRIVLTFATVNTTELSFHVFCPLRSIVTQMELREDWLNYFMTKTIYILINPVFWIYPFKVLDQQQIEDKFR